MKHFILVILLAFLTEVSFASDRVVTVPFLITVDERDLIPDKTNQLPLPIVVFSDKAPQPLAQDLAEQLTRLGQEDAEHYVYVLNIHGSEADSIVVSVRGEDVLGSPIEKRKQYVADLVLDRAHFVIVGGDANQGLLKRLFQKRGRIKFERVYEYVEEKIPVNPTLFECVWKNGELNITSFIMGGEDRLNQSKSEDDGERHE